VRLSAARQIDELADQGHGPLLERAGAPRTTNDSTPNQLLSALQSQRLREERAQHHPLFLELLT